MNLQNIRVEFGGAVCYSTDKMTNKWLVVNPDWIDMYQPTGNENAWLLVSMKTLRASRGNVQ